MPRAIVKPGVTHRVSHSEKGLGTLVAEGSIVQVTAEELKAFSDKLELYGQDVAMPMQLGPDEEYIVEVIEATDAAKALADEAEVDLADVVGSGEGGRILKRDVEDYLSETEDLG